ncbi:TPA: hypothetical protein QBQ37_005117 [Pseudomonas aeruginosa]|nr:hypothetical protein [Pseudomonas aeruginosa]HDQ8893398.1 hypothetical protein [Pseudomonas aeruginosa]HDQ8901348.1 hypothetical protein [Pseudomonas aeruginosa]HDQ8907214.1 hypothetical protein [Pseudomonas aeruginosa]HDQ8935321.1 hypothetical protein [Pseudomonas aeruginosa]
MELVMPCYRQGGGLLMEDAAPERLEAACAYRNASFLFQLDAACGAPVSVRSEGQAGALSLIRCLQPSSNRWVRDWLGHQFDFDLHRLALQGGKAPANRGYPYQ